MAKQYTSTADKGKLTRRNKDGSHAEGAGDDKHIVTGPGGQAAGAQDHYRSLLHFPINWSGMKNVIKVEIAVTSETGDTAHFGVGSSPSVWVHLLTEAFSSGNNGENSWDSSEYSNPSKSGTAKFTVPLDRTKEPPVVPDATRMYIDVTSLIQPIAPTGVIFPNGKGGGGGTGKNFGFMFRAPDPETASSQRMLFFSDKGSPKPTLVITYDPVNSQPTAPTITGPATANNAFGDMLTGQHNDPDGDLMKARVIQIRQVGTTKPLWTLDTALQSATSDESQTGLFSVPLSAAAGFVKLGTHYEWRAATQDSLGAPTAWLKSDGSDQAAFSAWRPFTVTSSAPTITAFDLTTVAKMDAAQFGGVYSDPDANLLTSFELQMLPKTTHDDAHFASPLAYLWATGETPATADEAQHKPSPQISRPYGGAGLQPGDYTYRIRARDSTGTWSPWSYDDFTLTEVFNPDPNPDDPTDPNDLRLTTQIARNAPTRIALLGMSTTGRGPGALIGYIDDPQDLGASAYLNSGGEMYFSLPATHPYCPVIEPHHVHYRVEQYYGDRYVPKFAGLITDFDADGDTATFYGTDYLGLLQTAVDDRFSPSNDRLAANGSGGGGSYYNDKTVDFVLKDQLQHHKAAPNSEVGFISLGTISALAERVTIHSTYAECLPFVGGLIDSHKQGTGRIARLYAKPSADYLSWAWTLTDNWGKDRPNIRLEWGGLLNDFRVVALGDFGTRILAVGQKRGEVAVYRATGVGGMDETKWGRRTQTRFYPDIIDQNDLQRRANEDASALAKVGKRVALALAADMLGPFDGYDLGDNIMVDIERGVVDTMLYGSGGFWNIQGLEWRYYADGHSDITFTVMPKTTTTGAPPDLIPSVNPGVGLDWQVGYGVPGAYGNPPSPTPPPTLFAAEDDVVEVSLFSTPVSDDPVKAKHYMDLNSGCVYELDESTDTYFEAYCPDTSGGTPPYVPDTTPPSAPIIRSVTSSLVTQEDGTALSGILANVGFDSPAFTDLAEINLQATRYTDQSLPPKPDFTRAVNRIVPATDAVGSDTLVNLNPTVAATPYWVRAAGIDESGNRSAWSSPPYQVTTVGDVDGPPPPTGIVVESGMNTFGLRWTPIPADDFWYTEVRWRQAYRAALPPNPSHVPPIAGYPERLAGNWTNVQTASTVLVVAHLINSLDSDPMAYDIQLRSVDMSGNAKRDTGVPDVNGDTVWESAKVTDGEFGWVDAPVDAVPTPLPGDALIWTSGIIEELFAGEINATWITGGALRIGNAPPVVDKDEAGPPRIEVYDAAGHLVGQWTTDGIQIMDPANNQYRMDITDASLTIWSGIGTVDENGDDAAWESVRITPQGIDAASITFGSMRGGHNLVQNSSFEMGAFGVTTNKASSWDVAADWNAVGPPISRVPSDVNVTTGASTITMTVI